MLNLYPVLVRGNAYLAAGDGRAAQTEFLELLDHPGLVLNEPIGVLAHLGVARAFRLQADTTKAMAAYEDSLILGKDADSDVPAFTQAKAELAQLH
jgi:eukaryotic-like serine/threonine-protein kinase